MLLVFRGCLVVRQSFFHNAPRNFDDLGGGVFGCRGFYSSFRPTNRGLSLNLGWEFHSSSVHFHFPFSMLCCFNNIVSSHRCFNYNDFKAWTSFRLSYCKSECQ